MKDRLIYILKKIKDIPLFLIFVIFVEVGIIFLPVWVLIYILSGYSYLQTVLDLTR